MKYQEIAQSANKAVQSLDKIIAEMDRNALGSQNSDLRDMFLRVKRILGVVKAEVVFTFDAMRQYNAKEINEEHRNNDG